MREYTTLTREAVDVVEGAAQYMSETTPMEHWSDKMIDLLLNGPTINGIKKDEVRALLRQTYAALKRYEVIGPMASPFMNDPTAIVALAFRELYPRLEYYAQYVPGLEDEEGKPACGLTIFPDDGSTPIVCISAEVPISAGPELLAHELAHVAAGEAVEHGPEWKAAEEAIFQKYNEILDAKIPDEPVEVTVTPHKVGDGGILAMPLKANIPDPQRDDWKLVTCPICGAECWENDLARQAMAAEPELRAACTTCALKAGVTAGGKHRKEETMNDNNKSSGSSGGIFWTLLAVAFIVLKVTHLIDWPWVWVLAPIWIPTGIVLAAIVVVLIVVLTKETIRSLERRNRR